MASKITSTLVSAVIPHTRVGATYMEIRALHDYLLSFLTPVWVRRPDEYGLSIKHATKVLRQPDARTGCGQA